MKQYLLSFVISLGATATVCCLNYFQSTFISCLGGLLLAPLVYWRLSVIDKMGGNVLGHAVLLVLGWLVLVSPVYISAFRAALGTFFISLSFGLSIVLACLCYGFKTKAALVVSAAVWLAFVFFAVGGWDDYLDSITRDGNGNIILPF